MADGIDYIAELTVDFTPEAIQALEPGALLSLQGRTAVVTGPAGGLGRWMAAVLGAAGARLFLVDRDRPALESVATIMRDAGCVLETLEQDVTEADAPTRITDECLRRFGSLDVLVNCAGVNRRMPILEVDQAAYDYVTGVNLRAPFFLSQAAARIMARVGEGAIINIGSITSGIGVEDSSVYGLTKAAIAHLTKSMAVEWARYGIRVNCIAPGFFVTPLAVPQWRDAIRSRWMLDRTPVGRPGRADELAGLVLLLASSAGRYINGQTIYVDGGATAGSGWEPPDEVAAREQFRRTELRLDGR